MSTDMTTDITPEEAQKRIDNVMAAIAGLTGQDATRVLAFALVNIMLVAEECDPGTGAAEVITWHAKMAGDAWTGIHALREPKH